MTLPAPTSDQAFCNISALEGGSLIASDDLFIADAIPGQKSTLPALCFLIHHSKRPEKFLFDLGINKDLSKYPPEAQARIAQLFPLGDAPSCLESLSKGGVSPDDVDFVCVSHVHWDHTGDTHAFKKSTFLVGGDCQPLLEDGYPKNPASRFASDLYPAERTRYLPTSEWPPLGPFPHAYDFYDDGSLYIIDSPGHVAGHINVLARTSSDGAWIYLAADSAHHWRLLTGESQIKTGMPYGLHFCMHADKHKAEEHIAHIRELRKLPRVQVILAHDGPWYSSNKGGDAFWPGKIQPLPIVTPQNV